jgi:sterol desaturase/sphingolipid hydroxylase (fatty acid hydroxylase superfamily)
MRIFAMLKLILSIISYDIWFYISHIILHNSQFYKYHSKHHTKNIPSFLDTYLGHYLEGPFQGIGMFIPFLLYQYSLYDTLAILLFLNIRGIMRHDERFIFLIGNHHLLHHRYSNYNFGEYWIDYLCGTKYPNNAEYRVGLIYI